MLYFGEFLSYEEKKNRFGISATKRIDTSGQKGDTALLVNALLLGLWLEGRLVGGCVVGLG